MVSHCLDLRQARWIILLMKRRSLLATSATNPLQGIPPCISTWNPFTGDKYFRATSATKRSIKRATWKPTWIWSTWSWGRSSVIFVPMRQRGNKPWASIFKKSTAVHYWKTIVEKGSMLLTARLSWSVWNVTSVQRRTKMKWKRRSTLWRIMLIKSSTMMKVKRRRKPEPETWLKVRQLRKIMWHVPQHMNRKTPSSPSTLPFC